MIQQDKNILQENVKTSEERLKTIERVKTYFKHTPDRVQTDSRETKRVKVVLMNLPGMQWKFCLYFIDRDL